MTKAQLIAKCHCRKWHKGFSISQLDPVTPAVTQPALAAVFRAGAVLSAWQLWQGLSLSCSFNEVKDDVQRYLSQVEHNELLEKNDKKELYLLFVNCLEVRAGL